MEGGRVFERLVLAFGDAQQDGAGLFAQVVAGGADQVADVFEEQNLEVFDGPVRQGALHHAGIQMAGAAGSDLAHGEAETGQAARVVIGLDIAGEHGDAPRGIEAGRACARAARFCPSRAS